MKKLILLTMLLLPLSSFAQDNNNAILVAKNTLPAEQAQAAKARSDRAAVTESTAHKMVSVPLDHPQINWGK